MILLITKVCYICAKFMTQKNMKKVLLFGVIFSALWACTAKEEEVETTEEITETVVVVEEMNYYGEEISPEGAISVAELKAQLDGQDSVLVKVEGIVNEACKKKGCWMTIDLGNDEAMRVSFKDYGFFVPKNLNGQKTIMEGVAKVETIEVDYLKHLAQDAGKTQEEIDAITEPEVSVTFVADGVIVYGEIVEEVILENEDGEIIAEEIIITDDKGEIIEEEVIIVE